jgi:hypothetical protein
LYESEKTPFGFSRRLSHFSGLNITCKSAKETSGTGFGMEIIKSSLKGVMASLPRIGRVSSSDITMISGCSSGKAVARSERRELDVKSPGPTTRIFLINLSV